MRPALTEGLVWLDTSRHDFGVASLHGQRGVAASAGSEGVSTVAPPRVLQERRMNLLGPPPASRKATMQMLACFSGRGLTWPATEGEFSAEGANAALLRLVP